MTAKVYVIPHASSLLSKSIFSPPASPKWEAALWQHKKISRLPARRREGRARGAGAQPPASPLLSKKVA